MEQYGEDSGQLNMLKKELNKVEDEYEEIIKKYNFLKERIEILEYRNDTPYNVGVVKDKYGNEYINVRISYPYAETTKKFPYYRIYVGLKKDIDSMSPDERKKRIQDRITKYLDQHFPL